MSKVDLPQVIEQQAGQELPSSSLACLVRIECVESTVFRAILCHEAGQEFRTRRSCRRGRDFL